jgi:hypothetical protein
MCCASRGSINRGELNLKQLAGRAWGCAPLYRPAPPGLAACFIAVSQTEHLSPFSPCAAALQEPFWVVQRRVHCSSAAAQRYLGPAFQE